MSATPIDQCTHESLEVGATPLIQHFCKRLRLQQLLEEHLPAGPGRKPVVSSAVALLTLVSNLLLVRVPLYALSAWAARRVPEHLGLAPGQAALLNDDRLGRALDSLYYADRASLLTALVRRVVQEFALDLTQFHNDTTSVTVSGEYQGQQPACADRPPLITFGYNKDHRPDLKQLLYSITVSADGAVPVHCKIYDGNTSDSDVHIETWTFLQHRVGHPDFLYVADSKLCSRANMGHIAGKLGRFLTVMPRTRSEDGWFRRHIVEQERQKAPVRFAEVYREKNPRRQGGPDIVYAGVESPQASEEGYRVLWYKSSQKQEHDRHDRDGRIKAAKADLEGRQGGGKKPFATAQEALATAQEVMQSQRVQEWLRPLLKEQRTEEYRQVGPGRPGPKTRYRREEKTTYTVELEEDAEALQEAGWCDGLFPLMSNDKGLSVKEALQEYKYQPFLEKRHQQLKSVHAVSPVWLKEPRRVASLLWVYFVVELVQALIEREVRQRMADEREWWLRLYPEQRKSEAPTAWLVFSALEGHRRHRLLDADGRALRTFYDPLSPAAERALVLLGVDTAAYGLELN
jgi:transposase